jgi:hypothetical protein
VRRRPTDPRARAQRKQNLLLASGLAREQAIVAFEEIGARADAVARVAIQVRAWAANPAVWMVGGVAASAAALITLPRVRGLRLAHWGLLALRAWRIALRVLPGRPPAAAVPARPPGRG